MIKKSAAYPHRGVAVLSLLIIIFTIPLSASVVIIKTLEGRTQSQAAAPSTPLVDKQDVVVLSERKVCSFVGPNQTSVHITGEDGGSSAKIGDTSYFVYGDVTLDVVPSIITNNAGTTTDTDASDCFSLSSKSTGGVASPTLPKVSGEGFVWPTDIVQAPDGQAHFFFASVNSSVQTTHVGLASMNTSTLESTRVIPVFFQTNNDPQVPNYKINSTALTRHGSDVYIFFAAVDLDNKEATLLAKVPAVSIANKSAYTYWNGSSFQADPNQMVRLWDQGAIGTHGMTIRYNPYLGKWTAIYNTGFVSEMAVRTASDVTGPWSAEMQIINCLQHFPLGASGNDFPCYGGKEHPQYQKNNGQTIYVSHSNTLAYQPFLHEIVLGKAINQFIDGSGNSVYKSDDSVGGYIKEGVAFYASGDSVPGYSAIKEWVNGSEHIYSTNSPGSGFSDSGTAFYAPTNRQWGLAPIYRWDMGTKHRYSALDLSGYGYAKGPLAFWAKITQYRAEDGKTFDLNGSNFEIGVKKDGNWVSGGSISNAEFVGLNPSTNYSIVTNTPFAGNRFFGQNISSDSGGKLSNSGTLSYVNVLNLGVFAGGQALNTSSDLFTYWVHHTGIIDNPPEIGHQLNPYLRGGTFKNMLLTGDINGTYEGVVCDPDCAGTVAWSGPVGFCENSITLSPTGSTKCAKLSAFTLTGFSPNTNYDVYYCMPSCSESVMKVVYPQNSDGSGAVKYQPVPATPVDTDGDGCTDAQELGPNERDGGQRDPNSEWDFADVPVPAIGEGVTSTKNKAVTLQDVGAALKYVGTSTTKTTLNANGVRYNDDYNSNGIPDGREYDRTPSADPSKPWQSGPPNNAVSLQDVGAILSQVGHNCN